MLGTAGRANGVANRDPEAAASGGRCRSTCVPDVAAGLETVRLDAGMGQRSRPEIDQSGDRAPAVPLPEQCSPA